MGNSEVGPPEPRRRRVVKQDLLRIDEAIEDGSFASNEALRDGLPRPSAPPPARARLGRRACTPAWATCAR